MRKEEKRARTHVPDVDLLRRRHDCSAARSSRNARKTCACTEATSRAEPASRAVSVRSRSESRRNSAEPAATESAAKAATAHEAAAASAEPAATVPTLREAVLANLKDRSLEFEAVVHGCEGGIGQQHSSETLKRSSVPIAFCASCAVS